MYNTVFFVTEIKSYALAIRSVATNTAAILLKPRSAGTVSFEKHPFPHFYIRPPSLIVTEASPNPSYPSRGSHV